ALHQLAELGGNLLLLGARRGPGEALQCVLAILQTRVERQRAAVVGNGLVLLPLGLMNRRPVVKGPGTLGIDLDRFAEIGDRSIAVATGGVSEAARMIGGGVPRIDFDRRVEIGYGAAEFAFQSISLATGGIDKSVRRTQLDAFG